MQEKNEYKLASEILEWTKKLDHIVAECELMAKKRDTSKNNEHIQHIQRKLSDYQHQVSEQIDELNNNLAKAKNDVREKIEETIIEQVAEIAKEKTITKITHQVMTPIKEHTKTLNSGIGDVQKGLTNLTKALDTQGKTILETTLENTTNFISTQTEAVKKKIEQFQETGSIKPNYEQLMNNIQETEENSSAFLRNPNEETFGNIVTSFSYTLGFFGRYLADKYNETTMIIDHGEKTVEKSIEKHGGLLPYAKSLVQKVDNVVESQARKLDRLDSLYRFYSNTKDLIASANCFAVTPSDSTIDTTSNPPELQSLELKK